MFELNVLIASESCTAVTFKSESSLNELTGALQSASVELDNLVKQIAVERLGILTVPVGVFAICARTSSFVFVKQLPSIWQFLMAFCKRAV